MLRGLLYRRVLIAALALAAVAAMLVIGVVAPVVLVATTAAVAVGLLAFLLPIRWAIGAWGALLPIWAIGSIPPAAFDAARAVGACVLVLRLWGESTPTGGRLVARWSVPIAAAGTIVGLVGYGRHDDPAVTMGLTTVTAVAVASAVIFKLNDPWPVLKGFFAGTVLSAVVLVLTAVGFSALSPQGHPGFFRYTGLSPSATRVTYELAIAVVIGAVMASRQGRLRIAPLAAAALCGVALLVSGGRGGVVAIALAAVVALRWGWLKMIPAVLGVGAAGIAVSQLSDEGVSANTLDRFLSASDAEALSNGRLEVLGHALQEIAHRPLLGVGMEWFELRYLIQPHIAPLAFAIAGGVVAGLIIAWLTGVLAATVLRRPAQDLPAVRAAYLIIAVLLVMCVLEPAGPFVGVETVTLLLVAVSVVLRDRSAEATASAAGLPSRLTRKQPA